MKRLTILFSILILTACRADSSVPLPITRTPAASLPAPTAVPTIQAEPSPAPDEDVVPLEPASGRLLLADYPASDAPYYIEDGDFWLVHTPQEQLYAFAPLSPEYREQIRVETCRFAWEEAVGRFIDPCSGDEWELTGRLNRDHSTELWSSRDLDQYVMQVQQGTLFVQLDRLVLGLPLDQISPAIRTQYGLTMTVMTADFGSATTTIDTLIQVAPIWQMDPTAFPPQQALTYPTFPDSLFDNEGRAIPTNGREGENAVFDARTGGLRQIMHHYWQAVEPEAELVTATLIVELNSLHLEVSIPIDWSGHQEGDIWEVNIPLEIGYAVARVGQMEWIQTLANGSVNLRLTVIDDGPDDLRLACLHLDTADPWQQTCANFEGENVYIIEVQPGEPVTLHLRANVELPMPFQLTVEVDTN